MSAPKTRAINAVEIEPGRGEFAALPTAKNLLEALAEWNFSLAKSGSYLDLKSDFCRLRVADDRISIEQITDPVRAAAAGLVAAQSHGWDTVKVAGSDPEMLRELDKASRAIGVDIDWTQGQRQALTRAHDREIEHEGQEW